MTTLTHINKTIYLEIDLEFITFINKLVSFLTTIGGLLAFITLFIPLYYLFFGPLLNILSYFLYKTYSKNLTDIILIYKNEFSKEKQEKYLNKLKKQNRKASKQQKMLFKSMKKVRILYYKPIQKQFKRLRNTLSELEDEMESINVTGSFDVPAYTDNEIVNFMQNNQQAHKLV